MRPKKRDVGDHCCFALPSCGDQFLTGRKVVSDGFLSILSQISHQVILPCSTTTYPSSQTTATAGLCMRRVSLPTRCQVGTRLLHAGFLPAWLDHHRFPTRAQKGQKSSAAVPPRCTPAPLHPLTTRTPPDVLRVGCGPVTPPLPISRTMRSS